MILPLENPPLTPQPNTFRPPTISNGSKTNPALFILHNVLVQAYIRPALNSTIISMVLKNALLMAAIGLAIGIPLAYCGMGLATSLIEDSPIQSAVPILSGIISVILIALLAAYLPARRASRVDPIVALRHE